MAEGEDSPPDNQAPEDHAAASPTPGPERPDFLHDETGSASPDLLGLSNFYRVDEGASPTKSAFRGLGRALLGAPAAVDQNVGAGNEAGVGRAEIDG